MLRAAAPELDIQMQLLVRGQYPDFGFLNQLPEMTTSNSVGQLVRSSFGYTAAAGAAQSNIVQQMLQMRPGEMSSCNPTDTLVQAMLASRSSGRLEDAVVGCGQKRGPSSISCYPACFETATASVEELAATTAAETYDDVGEDSISCAQYYNNNVESKKRRLTLDQVRSLERNFEEENKLESDRKLQLAKELGLQPRQVAVWFQNRRARWKTKQLERDYQVLTSDYNSLKTQLQAAIEEKQELEAKVQGLSAGKGKPGDQEESLGCETAAAEGAAGDEVRKVIRVLESTAAATAPSTLQQQLHPACSNDHAADDIQLMIKPESKLVVELSNNISCCRSADDVQIKNLHESARSAFLPDQDQVPSNCWTSRSKQLEYGSPISSTVASPLSEILDADSPRTMDSCTTLSQLTQVMDLKLLGTSFSSSFSSSSCGYSHELMHELMGGSAALDHTIVNPAASCMIDFTSSIITEEDMCCSNVDPPLILDHSPLRTVQDSSSYPRTTAIKLELGAADDHETAVVMGATSTIFQDSTDSCINYSLFQNQLAHVDAVVEHAAGLAGGSATALPWWDNWP